MKIVQVFVFLVALSNWTSMSAQIAVGIKAGYAYNTIHAETNINAINNAPKGYDTELYGITVDIPLYKNISFAPELLRTRKGFTLNEGTSFKVGGVTIPVGGKVETDLRYIESPLLIKATFGNSKLQGYGFAGPSIGYATSGTLLPKATLIVDVNLPKQNIDLTDKMYNRVDLSGIIGVGVQTRIGRSRLFADARYQHGFSKIIENTMIDTSLKNRSVQLTAGYAYVF